MALANITLPGAGSTTHIYEVFTPQVGKTSAALLEKGTGEVQSFSRLELNTVRATSNRSFNIEGILRIRFPLTNATTGAVSYTMSTSTFKIQLPDDLTATQREDISKQIAGLLANSQVAAAIKNITSFA